MKMTLVYLTEQRELIFKHAQWSKHSITEGELQRLAADRMENINHEFKGAIQGLAKPVDAPPLFYLDY